MSNRYPYHPDYNPHPKRGNCLAQLMFAGLVIALGVVFLIIAAEVTGLTSRFDNPPSLTRSIDGEMARPRLIQPEEINRYEQTNLGGERSVIGGDPADMNDENVGGGVPTIESGKWVITDITPPIQNRIGQGLASSAPTLSGGEKGAKADQKKGN